MDLVIASTNAHKIREIRAILKSLKQLDIYSLLDFPNYVPPRETGETFKENACLKAKHAAHHLGKWTLADDSGLVVPALKGAPGVYSARYAGQGASDKENRKKLLSKMSGFTDEKRIAYFECTLALASTEGVQKVVSASCEGRIIDKERGGNGFGYDPLFIKDDYNRTFAELGETVKNNVSHRAKAVEKIRLALENLI